jgi:signal transduction histidine kinase
LLGKELYEIGMFKDIEENKKAFRELQQNRYIRYDHLPVQNQRGERVEVEFVANVYHEDHRLVAQCNVRDIAPRIAMEKKIIAQAEALAEESRRKDQFLAMLSHELRNPLAPIRSATHLLKLQEHGSENFIQKQAREVIERQVANLTRLVSDLLEVSRVVSGRIRLNLTTVDMNQVVRHAIETARPLIEQRKHELTLNLCSDPVWANADATRMEEVFVNVLNNAAKYTPEGGRIEFHCERHQNHALARVRDNGIGIEADMLRDGRIFELFTQADRSLDHAAGGLGIGLSLVHRIVQLHGGTVEAQSDGPGKGSEFIVRLPLVPAPGVVQSPPAEEPSEQRPDGMRVLVVDDNIDACTMLSHALRGKGYGVQVAHTGPDGLLVAQQWRPDIVLLDIGLPGLDGYEVARRLRAEKTTSAMRVIAMTGYGRDTDIKLAREAGFDAHLTKPFDFDEMQKLIGAKS